MEQKKEDSENNNKEIEKEEPENEEVFLKLKLLHNV